MIKEIEDSTVFKAFKEAGKLNYFQGLQAYEIAKHGVALDLDDSVNGLKIQLTNLGGDTAPLVAKLKAQTLREFKQTLNEAATEFRKKEDKEFIGMLDDLQRIRQSMTPEKWDGFVEKCQEHLSQRSPGESPPPLPGPN